MTPDEKMEAELREMAKDPEAYMDKVLALNVGPMPGCQVPGGSCELCDDDHCRELPSA